MVRILKPGGKLLSLELSVPQPSWLQSYLMRGIPWLGRRFSSHPPAYEYLASSIFNHPPPEEIARLGKEAGLAAVDCHQLYGGLAVIHLGRKGS
jgi:demethylmenaquinone methyltransferase/2-methoxy-6-polyprenyl-1,4-benzoquinol methylase